MSDGERISRIGRTDEGLVCGEISGAEDVHACGVEGSGDETEGGGEPEEGFALAFGLGVFV